jgi:serine/threonine protein kinase
MAKDFPGLMKRVTSGYYDPIPSKYSKKLGMLIRKCLTIDFVKRPSAAELLQTDIFEMMESPNEGEIELLDTIRCPRVLKLLNKQLPENQFE